MSGWDVLQNCTCANFKLANELVAKIRLLALQCFDLSEMWSYEVGISDRNIFLINCFIVEVIYTLKMNARLIVNLVQLAMIANSCITDDCPCVSKMYEKCNFEKEYAVLYY